MSALKDAIGRAADGLADELESLSHRIHANPELGYQEVKAAGWLTEFLAAKGFKVEKGVAGVETAFRATLEMGEGPTIAILCEYDALPGLGHACGHNVIAASGAGAGAALAAIRAQLPKGRIQVIGTPAEEGGGGKLKLTEGGVFKDVDCAMMVHGFDRYVLHQDLLGIVRVNFDFSGKAAHASVDPWEGINALDAVIQTFNAISALRQQLRPDARVHGIITNGGMAPNIIPEAASATFYVRAATLDYMWEVCQKVVACAEGAAHATGAELRTVQLPTVYEPLKLNKTLLGVFKANLERLGLADEPPIPHRWGSSDIGNLSQVIPAIQPYVKIAETGTPIHSRAFAEAAVTPLARQGLVNAAKILAMPAADFLADPALVQRAKDEFAASR